MADEGKGGNLTDKQLEFVQDILSSYRMLLQLDEWNKQYGAAGKPPPKVEMPPK
jgi:hypothetical protein